VIFIADRNLVSQFGVNLVCVMSVYC